MKVIDIINKLYKEHEASKEELLYLLDNITDKETEEQSVIKCFMSDSGGAILKSEKDTIPHVPRKKCAVHQEKHLNSKEVTLMYSIINAANLQECKRLLNKYFEKNPTVDKIKMTKKMMRNSRFVSPRITQDINTNGACESINSILKRESFNGILSYIIALYDYEYNELLEMKKYIKNDMSVFVYDNITEYMKIGHLNVERISSNIAHVSQMINGKLFNFVVTKRGDSIDCTCNREKVRG